jgi:phage FluMu protein Com
MGPVTITCWKCGTGYDVADGADLRAVKCPQCKNPPTNTFQSLENAAYDRACDHARRGEKDAALTALEEALKSGVDLEIVDSDPALGKLRSDPRFAPLLKRYRPK